MELVDMNVKRVNHKQHITNPEQHGHIKLYKVYDCGELADCKHHDVGKSWSNACFKTLEEAREYANNWLGAWRGPILEVGVPYDYSGCGHTIEIRE